MNFEKLIDLARALKPIDHNLRTFHASFILHKTRIVAVGSNNGKTNPVNLRNPKYNREGRDISNEKYTCSEYASFIKLRKTNLEARRCSLVNIRIDRNDKLALSCPCVSCQSLLKWLNFRNVFYTDNDGNFVKA
jgi:hypothetical protein